ncbi:hypothetical protein CMV_018976 [Castanea mollissima]|uniref:Uncharacterized protein n=1 Tax=Castanea mollissima TaxID=60419 RepID=A0A8J4R3U6_9ROSI|nr:hypothetical protein CMV_018976 [Castanea mollissima]
MALWYQPPSALNLISPTLKLNSLRCNCNCNLPIPNSRPTHIPEPKPVFASVKTFAPATVAYLGLAAPSTVSETSSPSPSAPERSPSRKYPGLGSIVAAGAIAVNAEGGAGARRIEIGGEGFRPSLPIMGGFVLIRNYEPLDLKKLNFPEKKDLYFV